MNSVKPVRPSVKSATGPPPGRQQQTGEGAEEEDDECEMDSIASPTDAMEGDVGNPRELDDVDGFMADGDEIEIGDKDESIEIGAAKEDMEPIVPNTKDSRVPRALNAPIRPPAEDVESHNITHTPPRSWCDICVAAYGKEDPHFRGANNKE